MSPRRAATLGVAALIIALLASCTPAAPHEQPTASPSPEPPAPLTMAVVGDSISSWDPPFADHPEFSWATTARQTIPLVGGWALPGAPLGDMLANVEPAPDAYVLVIMGGTNDMIRGVPVDERLDTLDAIVAKVGVDQVVISTVAPYGPNPQLSTDWNVVLAEYATARGYVLTDPWAPVRTTNGNWVTDAPIADLVHPQGPAATIVADHIVALLEALWIADLEGRWTTTA